MSASDMWVLGLILETKIEGKDTIALEDKIDVWIDRGGSRDSGGEGENLNFENSPLCKRWVFRITI